MAFQEQLQKYMHKKNMKATDLAQATGLSNAIISDYLNGKKEPKVRQSMLIAKALNISLDILWESNFAADEEPEEEQKFFSAFHSLNSEGKKKVLDYMKDLIDTRKYVEESQKKYRYKFTIAARNKGIINHIVETELSPNELEKISKNSAVKRDDTIF
jgi:transcriptional regulator with XRE-family HTH domain